MAIAYRGGSRGGGSWGSGPPPFGGHLNFIKRGKTSRVCARKGRDLVLDSYPDPPPPFPNPVSAPGVPDTNHIPLACIGGSHWVDKGVTLGELGHVLGREGVAYGLQRFLDTNMLV